MYVTCFLYKNNQFARCGNVKIMKCFMKEIAFPKIIDNGEVDLNLGIFSNITTDKGEGNYIQRLT